MLFNRHDERETEREGGRRPGSRKRERKPKEKTKESGCHKHNTEDVLTAMYEEQKSRKGILGVKKG